MAQQKIDFEKLSNGYEFEPSGFSIDGESVDKYLNAVEGSRDIYEKNRDNIDMVILDMSLPDMSSEKIYEALRDINPQLKVLSSNNCNIEGQAAEILANRYNGFIKKPFNLKELS